MTGLQTNNYTVYVHTNKENGMRYVGITSQSVSARWQANGNGYRKQEHFWRAIKKYGWDNFEHEIVASGLSKDDACALEQKLILMYDSCDNTKGYNKSTGGEFGAVGVIKNDNQRTAASQALRKKWEDQVFRKAASNRVIALNQSEEMRKKRSESNHLRGVSDDTRKKISNAKTGHKLGPFSDEHKRKISEHHSGGADEVSVVCVETGEVFKSINDASRVKHINKKQISNCCRGVRHYNTAGGYHWILAGVNYELI